MLVLLVIATGCNPLSETIVASQPEGQTEDLLRTPPIDAPVYARNVVLIVADDLGWRDSSVYGSQFYRTPSLEKFASEGVTFTRAYSASPLCSPTRASLLTGLYPGRLGLTGADGHLPAERLEALAPDTDAPIRAAAGVQSVTRLKPDYLTIAEVLKSEGYATAFLGKWHLGPGNFGPAEQGFDFVAGGGEHSGPPGGYFAPWPDPRVPAAPGGTAIGDVMADAAIGFIDKHRQQPFFLTLFQYEVHAPYQASPEDADPFRSGIDPTDPQQSPTMGAMVEQMDRNIGQILDHLAASGLADSTVVIFSSDNGGNMYDAVDGVYPTSNAPLRGGKGNNYEGGVRVPLIVKWPGVTGAGTRSEHIVSTVDFFPTILDVLGVEGVPEVHVDGTSFAPALLGKSSPRAPVISHFPHNVPVTGNRPNASIFDGRWKLYRFFHDGVDRSDRFELYDLSLDEGEQNNLTAAEPEILEQLAAQLDTHLQSTGSVIPLANVRAAPILIGGWQLGNSTLIGVHDGAATFSSDRQDPWIVTDTTPQYDGPMKLQFGLRSNGSGPGRVYWSTHGGQAMNEKTAVAFDVQHDGDFHTYEVTLSANKSLRELRIDPSEGPGAFTLRNIELKSSNGYPLRSWRFPSGAH